MAKKKKPKRLKKTDVLQSAVCAHEEGLDTAWAKIIDSTETADARAVCLALMLVANQIHELRDWDGEHV